MTTPLTAVKGIGGATAARLEEIGIDSAETLAAVAIEKIAVCHGFGAVRAAHVRRAAGALLVHEVEGVKKVKKAKQAKKGKKNKNKKNKKSKKKAESKKGRIKKSGKRRKGKSRKGGKKKGKKSS